MKFSINRDAFLAPLQFVAGVVERRHTLPILSNLLLCLDSDGLQLVGSDQEVELVANIADVEIILEGQITVPARKLIDICRSLRVGAMLDCELVGTHFQVNSGRYRSQLGTLPAEDYPCIEIEETAVPIRMQSSVLSDLLLKTSFAMAQQDVRYFFNGMLLLVSVDGVVAVATNGQRLATTLSEVMAVTDLSESEDILGGYIVPRKGVLELSKSLRNDDSEVRLFFSANHLRVVSDAGTVTTKLIDATYPDFEAAIPKVNDNVVFIDRLDLKEALTRTAILSNETYRNIRLVITRNNIQIEANNPSQEEAEENITVDYDGLDLDIGFNVEYLIDALSVMKGDRVSMAFSDASAAVLLSDPDSTTSRYVVSPMIL
ncbi:MAG: DNA polymerase-3 subunit beta [Candidatus Azotimanducaceae bacterium]|jgi:DNA polymerase-3 subunit beta